MSLSRALVAILVALLLAVPAALAQFASGDAAPAAPTRYGDVQDPTNEIDLTYPGGPATTIGAPEIDLTEVWFEANATTVAINWQVVNLTHRGSDDEILGFAMRFHCGNATAVADIEFAPWGQVGSLGFYPDDGSRTPGYALHPTSNGNVWRVEVPRSTLACGLVTGELASDGMGRTVATLPVVGLGLWGSSWWHDRAPNNDAGAPDFTLPS